MEIVCPFHFIFFPYSSVYHSTWIECWCESTVHYSAFYCNIFNKIFEIVASFTHVIGTARLVDCWVVWSGFSDTLVLWSVQSRSWCIWACKIWRACGEFPCYVRETHFLRSHISHVHIVDWFLTFDFDFWLHFVYLYYFPFCLVKRCWCDCLTLQSIV